MAFDYLVCRLSDETWFMFDGVPYVAVDTSKTAERVRFDIAHEIGHLMMHEMVSEDVAIPSLSTFRPCDFRP